jgi:aminoglycoside phosphotransferase (APT) family kinase protein
MHGDYHSANVLVAPEPPARIAAILDWENCTIGDPLLDLAGFLHMTASSDRADWAERAELVDRWERASGRRAPDLRYYTALYTFKLAVMLEGVYQRSLADPTRGDPGAMGDTVLRLARDAADAAAITV